MKTPTTTLGKTDFQVSRIGLGTVEIGLPYGIGVNDIPSDTEAEKILKTAVEMGITYIDTARGYGIAEERIGKSGIAKNDKVIIGTKCAQWLKNEPDLHGAELEKRIREDIDTSRKMLGLERLSLVQLHIELADYTNLDELIEIMQKLQSEEKVQHIGIASRGEEVPLAAIASGQLATIQMAYSILDQRMSENVLPKAKADNLGVINRSVLLKGALTDKRTELPEQLAPLKENADIAAEIAEQAGIKLPDLALRFALSNPAISTMLIGTTKPEHLVSAISAAEAGPLSSDIISALRELAIEDPAQVDPANWPK